MTDPTIGIIFERDSHPAAKSFDDLMQPETASKVLCDERLPLAEALAREWDVDAHLILYALQDEDGEQVFARAAKRSPFAAQLIQKGGSIQVPILVFDFDLPKKAEWSEQLLDSFLGSLGELSTPRPTYFYTTLHGCRLIYQLTESVNHLKAEALARTIFHQFKAGGVELDESCLDWTRLFRLPKAKREDTGASFASSPMFMLLDGGPLLDPASIEAHVGTEDKFVAVEQYDGDMPGPDEVLAQLSTPAVNGKSAATTWVKEAKKYLEGRDAYAVCFQDALLDAAKHGGRNNAIVKIAGQIVGMTARLESASPEGIFALMYSALEQLQAEDHEGVNWLQTGWDIICRMWSGEQAQIAAEQKQREEQLEAAKGVRKAIVQRIREERPQDLPADQEAAEEAVKQRLIASDGRNHWVMRPDASYNIKPVTDSMLVPMIKELGMEGVIEINELRGRSWVTRSAKSILDEQATPIISMRCSSREKIAYIEGGPGYRTLHIPVHRLNPVVKPQFSAEVDEWLKVFFAERYDIGIEWLSHALEVAQPICALNLYGAPGAGKGMLVQGLAECFEGERLNDGRVLGKFNEGLLHTPIINCDEGVPKINSDESLAIDQAFRSFVTGGSITIRSMYQNPYVANIYPRILFTSNDRDILRSIVGHRDLTDDDIRAIELRLLNIQVPSEARTFLTSRGNFGYTNGWVAGKLRSKYTIANHIRFLFEHRKPSTHSSGRLLVEGQVDTSIVRSMRLRSGSAQATLKALAKMIESPTQRYGLHLSAAGDVYVTPAGLVDFFESPLNGVSETISLPRAAQVLRQFAAKELDAQIPKIKPEGADRGRWVEIDLGVLYEETLRYGMLNDRIEKLLRNQPDGELKIAMAKAHLEPEK